MTAERFRAALISCFAAVGLLLAMLGVFGTLTYSVAQRTFEIGIRMAFGAEKATILSTILQHAAKLACCGILFGLVLSPGHRTARLVTSMSVGIIPIDPLSLIMASALLLITAIAAAFAPGYKATRVEPMTALRS